MNMHQCSFEFNFDREGAVQSQWAVAHAHGAISAAHALNGENGRIGLGQITYVYLRPDVFM
ncbi:MAG: hypothetical protein J5I90_17780 [Caldilineales bacterium]|nr:hypothetical protein [Caldilineales bacterium]